MKSRHNFYSTAILVFLVICLSVVYPRLVYLSSLPRMDEGFYTYQTFRLYQNLFIDSTLQYVGTLHLYPHLLAPLASLPGKTVFWLRLADLIIAFCSSVLFCLILLRENKNRFIALVLAFVFLGAMNINQVIDSGFKNSIYAAYLPLFGALLLCKPDIQATSARWFFIGALVALGVLLREPLATCSILGFIAIWAGWNYHAAWRYAAGGFLAALVILLFIYICHKGLANIYSAYFSAGDMYGDMAPRIKSHIIRYSLRALEYFTGPLILFVLAFAGHFLAKRFLFFTHISNPQNPRKFAFLTACAILPLLEPIVKFGFLYHIAICLPGMAFLCASGLRFPNSQKTAASIRVLGCILFLACCQSLFHLPLPDKLANTYKTFVKQGGPDWDRTQVDQSNTLLAARALERFVPVNGSVSSSAFTYFLYAASGLYPHTNGYFDPSDSQQLSDLARSFAAMGRDIPRLTRAIKANPPDGLAIAKCIEEHEPDYFVQITEAVKNTGLYDEVAIIAPDTLKDYGWVGYTIYKRKDLPSQ